VVASFRQHTSRNGDPQLHVHNTILNCVQRERDGAWRTLDGAALYRERGAAAAVAALVMENALARDLGVEFTPRKDGHGREIRGISERLRDPQRPLAPVAASLPDGTPHADPFLAARGWQARGGLYVRRPQPDPEAG
jgi:hypothetical protein